ncbi:MAG: PD40 domain-containing protein, partial [Maribacter sp.]|nr:PD40 domain-containing protein [Maribacter sp.]
MRRINIILLIPLFGLLSCKTEAEIPGIDYSKEVVSSPIPFSKGVISTDDNSEFELSFSANGQTVYFSRRAPEKKQKIYTSNFENGKWTEPKLANFSIDRDETVSITPDGKYLFFGSERPIPGKPNKGNFDMNIWMME